MSIISKLDIKNWGVWENFLIWVKSHHIYLSTYAEEGMWVHEFVISSFVRLTNQNKYEPAEQHRNHNNNIYLIL